MKRAPEQVSKRQRFRYWFDNTMSRGTPALIGWLALISFALIGVFTVILLVLVGLGAAPADDNGAPLTPVKAFWLTFLHAFAPGLVAGDTGEWPFLLAMFGISLVGLFVFSSFIGVLTNGMKSKVDDLRRGRSSVLETGHSLILGWSDQVFNVVDQFNVARANSLKRGNGAGATRGVRQVRVPPIVILGSRDKVEMEEALRTKVDLHPQTRVVCRAGDPMDPDDLRIVNPQGARSIVILPSPATEDPDSQVLKTVLALTHSSPSGNGAYHIVAPIREEENLETAQLAGGADAQFVWIGETASRLVAQACRQPGLSIVYNNLLDYRGEAIYFTEEPSLRGKAFGDALFAYEHATIIGLQNPDGQVKLNPPMSTRIDRGDRVVALAADEGSIVPTTTERPVIERQAISDHEAPPPAPESFLVLGWNGNAPTMLYHLDKYVAAGSTVTVLSSDQRTQEAVERLSTELRNLQVTVRQGNTSSRRTLLGINPASYEHVVVLAYSDRLNPRDADARTLTTLLHLRQMKARSGARFSIVSEMLDERNRQLGEVAEVDDFIVGGKVFSLLMAQLAENKYLAPVYADLLSPMGSEIYLKPSSAYIKPGRPVSFYTVVEAARRRGEVAIGYRKQAEAYDAARSYGIVLNPPKADKVSLGEQDRVILLSEG
jgi:ion channel POLLUX/CASTOR